MSPVAVPASIRLGLAPADLPAALAFTRNLASSHYENFSVISFLLPAHLRQDFCNIYAFCRIADDLGDELSDRDESVRQLSRFKRSTRECFEGQASAAVFVALSQSIQKHQLPIAPFLDLIDAFEQDQRITRYETFDQLLDYCRRSANPVGRLVLYLCGYRDEERQQLSDQTCTALQLVNFWQDVRRDLRDRDRIYIPAEHMRRFGVIESQLESEGCDSACRALLRFEVDQARKMFERGSTLLPLLDRSVRKQIALFGAGGIAICRAIEKQNYDTLSRRPRLSRLAKLRLAMLAAFGVGIRSRA